MRIKVVARAGPDGIIDPARIRVIDAETGAVMRHVRSVDLHADNDSRPILTLEVYPSEVEIEAEAETVEATTGRSPDHA